MVFHIRLPRRLSQSFRRSSMLRSGSGKLISLADIDNNRRQVSFPAACNASNMQRKIGRFASGMFRRQIYREFLAEFLATFMLLSIGNGTVLMNILTNGTVRPFINSFAYGVGVLVGASLSIHISGAHMNPACTVAAAICGKFPWTKVLPYMTAQFWGAFLSSAVLFETYYEAIEKFDGGIRSTQGSDTSTGGGFATFPAGHVTIYGAFSDQVIGTALLLVAVNSVCDSSSLGLPKKLIPLYLALIITALCTGFGLNCGAIFNPARDLSPRIFLVVAGYGWDPFRPLSGNYWWVAGIIGPHLGAIVGQCIYSGFIGLHASEAEKKPCQLHNPVLLSDSHEIAFQDLEKGEEKLLELEMHESPSSQMKGTCIQLQNLNSNNPFRV